MDIDIDEPRIETDPQRVRRLTIVMQDVAVGFAKRMCDDPIADIASVDERVLPARLGRVRRTNREAGDGERPRKSVDG
jgi:hypothetical protein